MKRLLLLGMLPVLGAGCATLGSAIKLGGQLSGYSELSEAGENLEKSDREFTEEEKYYIGRTVAASLLAGDGWESDPALTRYVNAVGETLVLGSGRPEQYHGYHFAVLKAPGQKNAFACPGGFVFITSGLLRVCRSEDELAGVLAHEMAHLVLEHPIQAIQAGHQRAAIASLVKFGVRKASESREDLQHLTGVFDGVIKDVTQAVAHGYSRDKEQEADLRALRILGDTGYAPAALAEVLSRLESQGDSHGDPKARAAVIEAEARREGRLQTERLTRRERFDKQVNHGR